MSRNLQMDEFLKGFAKLYMQNPNLSIIDDQIYSQLALYGLNQSEIKDGSIEDIINIWIKRYKYSENLNVYVSQYQPGFLQFQNAKSQTLEAVKLYVSYPKDKIYSCVNKIFDYISSNDMETYSKVSMFLRSDSVVLRMTNFDDAIKVMNFINNDKELRQYAKPTNPFSMKNGVVGMAYDNRISYNYTLAMLMEEYFKECKLKNRLPYVSIDDFRVYVDKYCEKFNAQQGLNQIMNTSEFKRRSSRFNSKGEQLVNYEHVINLISKSLDENFSIEEYKKSYFESVDKKNNSLKASIYNDKLDNTVHKEDIDLFHEYLEYVERKYGKENIAKYLEVFLNGEIRGITRENGFRDRFEAHLTREKILKITGYNINSYIENYTGFSIDADKLIKEACLATYEKYGYLQLYMAIKKGLSGIYESFTNGEQGYRNKLKKYIYKEDFAKFCLTMAIEYNQGDKELCKAVCDVIEGISKDFNNSKQI